MDGQGLFCHFFCITSLIIQKETVPLHRFFAASCDNPHRVMAN